MIRLDLSPDRPVSSRNPHLTLGHVLAQAESPEGFSVLWSDKDHRLLRICKTLVRHHILTKDTQEPGATKFYAHKHFLQNLKNNPP